MKRERDIFIIIVIIMQVSIVVFMNNAIRVSPDIQTVETWMPFWEIVVLILAILSIASIHNIEQNAREQIQNSITKSHMQQIETLLHTLSLEKHEFTRHLQALQSLIYLNRIDDAKKYLDGIAEGYWQTDNIKYIGHPSISGLLNSKSNLAQSQGIQFSVSVDTDFAKLTIEPWDFCSILGNLLDNAIEAALLDQQQAKVKVEFKYESGNYVIYVRNNGASINADQIKQIFQAGYTTKNSVGRGYGLFISKTLAERYGGSIECFSHIQTTFMVRIPDKELN